MGNKCEMQWKIEDWLKSAFSVEFSCQAKMAESFSELAEKREEKIADASLTGAKKRWWPSGEKRSKENRRLNFTSVFVLNGSEWKNERILERWNCMKSVSAKVNRLRAARARAN